MRLEILEDKVQRLLKSAKHLGAFLNYHVPLCPLQPERCHGTACAKARRLPYSETRSSSDPPISSYSLLRDSSDGKKELSHQQKMGSFGVMSH
jgi:hypothetical protein